METAIEARDRWRAVGDRVTFTPKDFEVLDLTLCLVPDLRVCALALRRARAAKVAYPVESVEALIRYLDKGELVAGKHVIDAESVRSYLHEGFFPLEHEGALLSAVYAGLTRHRYETGALRAVQRRSIERALAAPPAKEVH